MVFFADPCHLGGKTIDSLRNCFLTSTDFQMIQWKIIVTVNWRRRYKIIT